MKCARFAELPHLCVLFVQKKKINSLGKVKKFPIYYGAWKFITMYARAYHFISPELFLKMHN
jgi:hypothetical protein